jgi:hypothetical protein
MRMVFLLAVALCPVWAQDAAEIVRKSMERDQRNFEELKNYTFRARTEVRELDKNGGVQHTDTHTDEVMILAGRPYERRIAKNDKPLSPSDSAKEQRKLDRELEKRQRETASEKSRAEKERMEARKFLREFTEAYQFTKLGEDTVSGRKVWIIEANPNPKYKARSQQAKIFVRVRGKLWIDEANFQWARVEAQVLETISFGLFLVRLAPGASFTLEQTRVNDEVWLPSRIDVRADARLGLILKMRAGLTIVYSDYQKFQADSRLVPADDKEGPVGLPVKKD